jgi:hypothetical protein
MAASGTTLLAGRQILFQILCRIYFACDWIDLVQDRDRWRALVNAVMNLQVE